MLQDVKIFTILLLCYYLLGILLKMGLVQLPAIHEYWATDWYSAMPFFGKAMGRNRFQEIYQNLLNACNDDLDDPLASSNVNERNIKSNKIQPFISKLASNFQKCFIPYCNIVSAESLIGFKGKLSLKSFNLSKPTKWDIAAKTLTDSKTGYLYNINIHYSQTAPKPSPISELTKTDQAIVELVTPLFGMGYHTFCNRLYTSPHLAETLLSKQVHLTGMMMNSCYGLSRHKAKKTQNRRSNKSFPKWIAQHFGCSMERQASNDGDFHLLQCQWSRHYDPTKWRNYQKARRYCLIQPTDQQCRCARSTE